MTAVGTRSDQQSALYRAESGLGWGSIKGIDKVQNWVDSITSKDWWADRYPHIVRIEVEGLHGNVSKVAGLSVEDARNGGGVIYVSKTEAHLVTVIHEMAHCVSPEGVGHGPEFVRNYMVITNLVLGSESYLSLYNSLKANGVDMG